MEKEKRTERINMKVLPSLKAAAEAQAIAEGRTLSNYIETLIRKGENAMRVGEEDMMLSKEGRYWTLYIGEHQCGCGFLEDMIEEMQEIGERLDKGCLLYTSSFLIQRICIL